MAWPPNTHQDVTDAVSALQTAPPVHKHAPADLITGGSKSAVTFLSGDDTYKQVPFPAFPIQVVGTPSSPITSAATARPTGYTVVYWLCANGVNPTNATGADLIWNAP